MTQDTRHYHTRVRAVERPGRWALLKALIRGEYRTDWFDEYTATHGGVDTPTVTFTPGPELDDLRGDPLRVHEAMIEGFAEQKLHTDRDGEDCYRTTCRCPTRLRMADDT